MGRILTPVLSPGRFQEKGNLEVLLFTIQSKLRATNRKLYVPSEGKSISDINKVLVGWGGPLHPGGSPRGVGDLLVELGVPPHQAWTCLEKAEHEREASLRNELIRQEKLELLAQRFDHKAVMRETWLNENQRLVSQVGWDPWDPTPTLGQDAWGASPCPGVGWVKTTTLGWWDLLGCLIGLPR